MENLPKRFDGVSAFALVAVPWLVGSEFFSSVLGEYKVIYDVYNLGIFDSVLAGIRI